MAARMHWAISSDPEALKLFNLKAERDEGNPAQESLRCVITGQYCRRIERRWLSIAAGFCEPIVLGAVWIQD